MLIIGGIRSSELEKEDRFGINEIPANSKYVRSIYEKQLDNNAVTFLDAATILKMSGRNDDARKLETFYGYCNIQRLLGKDDACSTYTVQSAIDHVSMNVYKIRQPQFSSKELAKKIENALTFSLATSDQLRNITPEKIWEHTLFFENTGVLSDINPRRGVHIFITGRNDSTWEIARYKVQLLLPGSSSSPKELKCDSKFLYPFYSSTLSEPKQISIASCDQPNLAMIDKFLSMIDQARKTKKLLVNMEQLTLKNPDVEIISWSEDITSRFKIEPVRSFGLTNATATEITIDIRNEVAQIDCKLTRRCSAWYHTVSMLLFNFSYKHYIFTGLITGFLMGLGVGGLVQKPLRSGSIFAGGMVGATILVVLLIFLLGDPGKYAGLIIAGIFYMGVKSLLLWLPTFFAGLYLIRLLNRPSSENSEASLD